MKKNPKDLIHKYQNRSPAHLFYSHPLDISNSPVQILILILFWLFVGVKADQYFHSKPIFTLIFLIIASCQILLRVLKFK